MKTKEETFTDPILSRVESKKGTTETQDGTVNNVITFQQTNNNHQHNESGEIGDTLVQVLTSPNIAKHQAQKL